MFKLLKNIFKKKDKITISGSCQTCGSCCKGLHIFDRGEWLKSPDRLKELQEQDERYKRLVVIGKIKKGYLTLKCTALGEDNRCTEYETRFDFCDSYPNPVIFKRGARLSKGCGYNIHHSISFDKILTKKIKKIDK